MQRSWIAPPEHPFGPQTLPYGVFSAPGRSARIGVRIGDSVLDLAELSKTLAPELGGVLRAASLGPLMAAGPATWSHARETITHWVCDAALRPEVAAHLVALDAVQMYLPFEVADYVDFFSSRHHSENFNRMFRSGQALLTPNWLHMPIAYHGRAGTVIVSGSEVYRPSGQRMQAGDGAPDFGPTARLDIEAEVGFVVGVPSRRGQAVPVSAFDQHVFGVVLLNDWSARDIQQWEAAPLGPFLSKSFATSVSAWVTPLAALEAARVLAPPRERPVLPYLEDEGHPWGLDIAMAIRINGVEVSRPNFRDMYWTAAQQLAHMTVNGASLRTGDLYGSGTVSGPEKESRGSLTELTWNGQEPLQIGDATRVFLHDGDEVVLCAVARGPGGLPVGLGDVRGVVRPRKEG